MRLMFTLVELETMSGQALPQRINQLHQLLRHMAGCGIHDLIVPPVVRLIKTQLETFRSDFLSGKLQRFKPGLLDPAAEYQRGMQRFAEHRASTAEALQRRLPRGQFVAPGCFWPQGEEYPRGRVVGCTMHSSQHFIRISDALHWGKMCILSNQGRP